MSTRRSRVALALAGLALSAAGAACSSGHSGRATAPTVAPGTVTVDVWKPPQLAGPPAPASFCRGLVAVYQHMGQLQHAGSKRVTEQILSDYVTFAPTLVRQAPPGLQPAASAYIGAVAAYLQSFVRAGLDLNRMPAGSLAPLTSSSVNTAYTQLTSFVTSQCHYVIGAGAPSA